MKTGMEVFNTEEHIVAYDVAEAINVLESKLDQRWIKTRTVGNATLSYIGGQTVIRLLNKAFNYQWSFEIVTEDVVQSIPKYNKWAKGDAPKFEDQPPVAKVLGRLTVPGLGVKEQYGSKVLIGGASEQESAFKSAGTDALKKCASLFGIGLELYGEDEGMDTFGLPKEEVEPTPAPPTSVPETPKQEEKQPAPTKPAEQAPAPETPVEPPAKQAANGQSTAAAATGQWRGEDVQKLKDMKGILGITTNEELDGYIKKFFDNEEVTYRNITPENIKAVNIFLAQQAESI